MDANRQNSWPKAYQANIKYLSNLEKMPFEDRWHHSKTAWTCTMSWFYEPGDRWLSGL